MRKMIRLKFLAIWLLGLLVINTVTAQGLLIKGKIMDAGDDTALMGANVFLKSSIEIGTTSDASGLFSLMISNQKGNDTLIISFIGYQESKIPVNLEKDLYLTVKLNPIIKQINEITVSASPLIAEEFTIKKIKKLDIYLNPSAKADPLLAVNSMPAATTLDESANISLRGSTPAETGVFLNQVPIYDAIRFGQLNGIGTFSIFNTAIVKNLNVFPSNPPLEYGNTTSGLITITSESSIPKKSSHSAILSMANVGLSSILKTGKKSSLIVFGNYQPSFLIKKINNKALNSLKAFNAADLGMHYYKQLSNRTDFKVFNYIVDEGYKFVLNAPSFEGDFNQAKTRNFTVVNLNHHFKKNTIAVNQGFSISKTNFDYSKALINLKQRDLYSSINYRYNGEKLSIKTGVSYDQRVTSFNGIIPEFSYAIGESAPFILQNSEEESIVPEFYLYAKYNLNENWVIGSGLRRNLKTHRSGNYYSYQANISYRKGSKHHFHASMGKYHQFALPDRDFDIKTFITSQQVSLDYKFKSRLFQQEVGLFYKQARWNDSKNEVAGFEMFSQFNITSKMQVGVSYTFLNGKVSEGDITFPSKYDIDYFIKGNISYKWNGLWTVTSNFIFRQGNFYRPVIGARLDPEVTQFEPLYDRKDQQSRLPAYNIVDFSITKMWPISESLVLITFANVGNVFNFENVRDYNFNFDYTQKTPSFYSRRVTYFGVILNF